jgi:hypothetical protein
VLAKRFKEREKKTSLDSQASTLGTQACLGRSYQVTHIDPSYCKSFAIIVWISLILIQ